MHITFFAGQKTSINDADFEGKGVGGSEASFICLTRALARQGCKVVAYTRGAVEGVHHGVEYRDLDRFDPAEPYDVLVLFRVSTPWFETVRANRKLFWSCDIDWRDWDKFVFPFADLVLCLSEYHREFLLWRYPNLKPEIIRVLGLGVDEKEFFDQPPDLLPEKRSASLLYCSVPERGLDHLARLFPKIKEAVPEAELWITSDYSLWGKDPGNAEFRALFAKLPDVHFLGKISRAELIKVQKSCQVMAYPCVYHEAFCLAALECMSAGAVPVTTNDFALTTTVGDAGVLVHGFPGEPEYDDRFVHCATVLLQDEDIRTKLARYARRRVHAHHTWTEVAKRMEQFASEKTRSG